MQLLLKKEWNLEGYYDIYFREDEVANEGKGDNVKMPEMKKKSVVDKILH